MACAFTESVGDAVLILTGGLNPVHRAHVTAMEIARARCEEAGYRVVAGYLSPSHDTYVGPKMRNTGARCFSATDRIALVKSAVASSPWLDVAAWEGLGPHSDWPDYPDVCLALAEELSRRGLAVPTTTVFFVCGFDHYSKCAPAVVLGSRQSVVPTVQLGVVVISRSGKVAPEHTANMADRACPCALQLSALSSDDDQEVSSTIVRQILCEMEVKPSLALEARLRDLVPDGAVDPLLKLIRPPATSPAPSLAAASPSTVRILHMSDTHGLHNTLDVEALPPADILIHTGDFTNRGSDEEFRSFDEWLGSLAPRFKHIVVIPGNHEFKETNEAHLDPGFVRTRLPHATHVLHHEVVTLEGIKIFGSGWCPWHDSATPGDRASDVTEYVSATKLYSHGSPPLPLHYFDLIPSGVDLLLTHGPAWGIFDRMETTANHWGSSRSLLAAIERSRPKVHLFGHMHEQRGLWERDASGDTPYRGGVEYQAHPGQPWHSFAPPPVTYPCQLISCNAMKNHPRLEGRCGQLVGQGRLIIARRQSPDMDWVFTCSIGEGGEGGEGGGGPSFSAPPSAAAFSPHEQASGGRSSDTPSVAGSSMQVDRGDAPQLPPAAWKVPEAVLYDTERLGLMSEMRKEQSRKLAGAQPSGASAKLPTLVLPTASNRPRSWFAKLFGFEEIRMDYASARAQFTVDAGFLVSHANGRRFDIGKLSTPSAGTLASLFPPIASTHGRQAFAVIHEAITGALELHARYPGAIFQAASQTNCLEAVNPRVGPAEGIQRYEGDRTQGPDCALACAAGTLFRNYFAQTPQVQMDTLDDFKAVIGDGLLVTTNGYVNVLEPTRSEKHAKPRRRCR